MIHIIGDSHVNLFYNGGYVVHWIGAITANNLISPISTTRSNQRLLHIIQYLKHNTTVILSAGEIDCRIHIYYQYKKNHERNTLSEYISATVNRYLEIINIISGYDINLYILGIPPAGTEKNLYGYKWYAPAKTRVWIYKTFNAILKEKCKDKQIKYIDIYSETVGLNGFIDNDYTNDGVHLNKRALPIIESKIK